MARFGKGMFCTNGQIKELKWACAGKWWKSEDSSRSEFSLAIQENFSSGPAIDLESALWEAVWYEHLISVNVIISSILYRRWSFYTVSRVISCLNLGHTMEPKEMAYFCKSFNIMELEIGVEPTTSSLRVSKGNLGVNGEGSEPYKSRVLGLYFCFCLVLLESFWFFSPQFRHNQTRRVEPPRAPLDRSGGGLKCLHGSKYGWREAGLNN